VNTPEREAVRVAYVGIHPACGHVRAAHAFNPDDIEKAVEAGQNAKRWKRAGLVVERWDDMDRVRAGFGWCAACDRREKKKASVQLELGR